MAGPDNWTETAARVRAAMAYGSVGRVEAARAMGTTPGTLDRIAGKKGSETKLATWQQLWQLADLVGLEPDFFAADFARLSEIVPAGSPTVVRPTSLGAGEAGSALAAPGGRAAARGVDDTAAREAIAAAQAGPPARRSRAARGSARATRARRS